MQKVWAQRYSQFAILGILWCHKGRQRLTQRDFQKAAIPFAHVHPRKQSQTCMDANVSVPWLDGMRTVGSEPTAEGSRSHYREANTATLPRLFKKRPGLRPRGGEIKAGPGWRWRAPTRWRRDPFLIWLRLNTLHAEDGGQPELHIKEDLALISSPSTRHAFHAASFHSTQRETAGWRVNDYARPSMHVCLLSLKV